MLAITGATGRLGSALRRALAEQGVETLAWSRPMFDLDAPGRAAELIRASRPDVILHAAAWTDVDGCAREPDLAMRRNGTSVAVLAQAAAESGSRLLLVSTNEVFDGRRDDGRGYREGDPTRPINAYGRSKLAGEDAAREAFERAGRPEALWIVRTAWLFGPPGNDFPSRIVAAARRLPDAEPLPVVADETGSPTYTRDLAAAILTLVAEAPGGLYHLVNAGSATRREWADAVLARCAPGRVTRPITQADHPRPSSAPRWAVLDASTSAKLGIVVRPWQEALAAYLELGCP